jgi:hypothetical protein
VLADVEEMALLDWMRDLREESWAEREDGGGGGSLASGSGNDDVEGG